MGTNSGPDWVNHFPTSHSLDDLAEPFRTKAKAFHHAMLAAGMQVSISATYRPPERAYLMHYAYQIANGEIAPSAVPPMAGVDIVWNHPGAVAAAQAMVDGYGEVSPGAVLHSRHTLRQAVDWDISWTGEPHIVKPDRSVGKITSLPRDGGNPDLQHIGSLYGVLKLQGDPPHWSADGH